MITDAERMRLKKLFSDTISLLCRSGLPGGVAHRVDALIGVTLDSQEVVLVNFSEDFWQENGIAARSEEIADNNNVDEAQSNPTHENSSTADACSYGVQTKHGAVKDEVIARPDQFTTEHDLCSASALVPDTGFENDVKPIDSSQDSVEHTELLCYANSAIKNCSRADGFLPESVEKTSASESDSDCLIVKTEIQNDAAQVNSLPVEGENLIASSSSVLPVPAFHRSSYASVSNRMKHIYNVQRHARRNVFGYKFYRPQQRYCSISEPSPQVGCTLWRAFFLGHFSSFIKSKLVSVARWHSAH